MEARRWIARKKKEGIEERKKEKKEKTKEWNKERRNKRKKEQKKERKKFDSSLRFPNETSLPEQSRLRGLASHQISGGVFLI